MRPLIVEIVEPNESFTVMNNDGCLNGAMKYEHSLAELKAKNHSQCLFNRHPSIVPGLKFWFDDAGTFHGSFRCNTYHQGYDKMVHGGIIAAIVDASMAQCLMGHGVVGYTTNLSIKYRKPVKIDTLTELETSIVAFNCGVLYSIRCRINQKNICVVNADGRFFKVK